MNNVPQRKIMEDVNNICKDVVKNYIFLCCGKGNNDGTYEESIQIMGTFPEAIYLLNLCVKAIAAKFPDIKKLPNPEVYVIEVLLGTVTMIDRRKWEGTK